MKYFSFLLFIIFFQSSFSQENTDVFESENFKTILLKSSRSNNYSSIIKLNESFTFSFDDLEATQEDYYYKIDHYTYDWKPSGLSSREFIDGYEEDRIRNIENSFNTLQCFTHYSVNFPNRNTKITISGNYKISILNDENQILFTLIKQTQ